MEPLATAPHECRFKQKYIALVKQTVTFSIELVSFHKRDKRIVTKVMRMVLQNICVCI